MHKKLEGAELGQLTPADKRDVAEHVVVCSEIRGEVCWGWHCLGSTYIVVSWWWRILVFSSLLLHFFIFFVSFSFSLFLCTQNSNQTIIYLSLSPPMSFFSSSPLILLWDVGWVTRCVVLSCLSALRSRTELCMFPLPRGTKWKIKT